ncbi:MAG TPA: TerB family tellurite resistance protein [Flavisolibacter sp.]|jgi:uncharacterized tellurite resistance protein B-like protein|nr:TerB family tellurite resistance protein [Flavisolibacter sp.]
MEQNILEGYSDAEKGAYLSAIASLATADRVASEEELQHLSELATAANLPEDQLQAIESAASETSGESLNRSLDVLKNSQLKYSLVTDLIAFAKSDADYSEEEQGSIKRISTYLGVNQEQFGLLDQFAQKAADDPQTLQQPGGAQNFFGFGDKMKSAGINTGGLFKSLLSIAAPMLIGGMLSRGLGGRSRGGSGLGGMLGGGGGLGGMLGGLAGGGMGGGGGLGSLIGMLSGGRGLGSAGGMLGKVLGGRF